MLPCTVLVHIISNSYKANALFPEHNLGIKANLQIIPANSAHILSYNTAHFSGLNIPNEPFPVRPFKVAAAPTVVGIMLKIDKTVSVSIILQHILLINNGVAFSSQIVI